MFQWLGFTDAARRIAQASIHEIKQALGRAPIFSHPVPQVIKKLRMADRQTRHVIR
ncbi:hypothetical protein [Thiorhodovibrio winogradskyi]|uniref:hypothetical protein n=1 Tax=Thiorhodovibrio winogradskyi TaxID=77007 RepID=UPI002E292770|nr:hypothetical protein [Thiorhodovibrio winogradskyi]